MKQSLVILLIISIIGMVFVGCTKEQPVDVNQPVENNEEQNVDVQENEDNEVVEEEEVEVVNVGFEVLNFEELDEELQEKAEGSIKKEGYTVLDEEESIILIALGERPTGGYSVDIEAIEKNEDGITIIYVEFEPSEDDNVTEAIEYPYIIIKIDSEVTNLKLLDFQDLISGELEEDTDQPEENNENDTEEKVDQGALNNKEVFVNVEKGIRRDGRNSLHIRTLETK